MKFSGELPQDVDLLSGGAVYFVGIKGVGMAALALLLSRAGIPVHGADTQESFVTDAQLSQAGILVEPFDKAHLGDSQVVVYSGAHRGEAHPLVQQAKVNNIPCLTHAQAIGLLTQQKETIGVCGVGGKSTTSALVATILDAAGKQPSYAVGVGSIPNLGQSGNWNSGSSLFVLEADEYVADPLHDITPRFLYLRPKHIIATSVRFDHPDVYGTFEDTKQAFRSFFSLVPPEGYLVLNGDDQELVACAQDTGAHIITVGEDPQNDITLQFFPPIDGSAAVVLRTKKLPWEDWTLELEIPGQHNLRNAAYAAVLCRLLGTDPQAIQKAVMGFLSTPRRFEFRGENVQGARFFDDYAHHPHELQAVSNAMSEWFPQQDKVLVFQPHTYSRTRELLGEFAEVLSKFPGKVILLPIFASAREQDDASISSAVLASLVEELGHPVLLVKNLHDLSEYLQTIGPNTVALTAGAGDVYKVYDHLSKKAKE